MARAVLFFFFISPVWAAWWLALVLAAAEVRGNHHCPPKRCGNVTLSVPFGLESEPDGRNCALLGFQVHCNDDTPYLGYYKLGFGLQILEIFYDNHTLLVSDIHKLGDFNKYSDKGCHVPTADTASKVGAPFSISILNQNLIFYKCTKAPTPAASGLVERVCGNDTLVRAGGRYNETDGYALEGCNATFVPVRGASGKVNASNYKELISEGFLLTWQPAGSSGKLT